MAQGAMQYAVSQEDSQQLDAAPQQSPAGSAA